jgi:hypothetical protein
MLNNMIASFTASNQIGEAMKAKNAQTKGIQSRRNDKPGKNQDNEEENQ